MQSSWSVLNAVTEGLDMRPGIEVSLFRSDPHGIYTCRIYNPSRTSYFEGWSAESLVEAMKDALRQADM